MDLAINKPDSIYNFSGKGSVENKLFYQVFKSIKKYTPFEYAAVFDKIVDTPPADFIKQMDEFKADAFKQLDDTKGLSKYFIKTQKGNIEYMAKSATYSYKLKYGVDPQVRKEMTSILMSSTPSNREEVTAKLMTLTGKMFVKRMDMADMDKIQSVIWENFDDNNGDLYKFSTAYRTLLEANIQQSLSAELVKAPYLRSKNPNERKFDVINKEITNDYIKQRLLHNSMLLLLKRGDNLDANYNKYMAVVTDKVYKAEIASSYNDLKLFDVGGSSPLFVYNDVNDKQIALSSFKGSYVYIDVWATWCGPCIAEIQSLKTVEEKYGSKNIKFVSVSIDQKKDIGKWKKFVSDKSLGGVQVITEDAVNSAFIKHYGINTIPRFILLDPEGKIVSTDAARPSNPALQTQLDKLLN